MPHSSDADLGTFLHENTIFFPTYQEYRDAVAVAEDFTRLLIGKDWEAPGNLVRMQIPLCRVQYSSKEVIDIGGMVFGGLEAFIVSQHLVEKAISHIARRVGVRFSFHLSVYGGKWKAGMVLDGGTTGTAQHAISSLALMRATIIAVETHLAARDGTGERNDTGKDSENEHQFC